MTRSGRLASTASTFGSMPSPRLGTLRRFGRIVAPFRAADDRRAGADREEQLSRGGDERHDAPRHGPQSTVSPASSTAIAAAPAEAAGRQATAPTSSAASARWIDTEAGNENRPSSGRGRAVHDGGMTRSKRHRPSPEGTAGGANGEVSWLRAFARLPGCPVACERNCRSSFETVPVTVAGPHRYCTGFRASPFANFDCPCGIKRMGAGVPRQGVLEPRLERARAPSRSAPTPRRRVSVSRPRVASIERSDGIEQGFA